MHGPLNVKYELHSSEWANIFQYFGLIRCNSFIFLKGSFIMRNINIGVDMRLLFLMPVLMNIPGILENATVATGRERPHYSLRRRMFGSQARSECYGE